MVSLLLAVIYLAFISLGLPDGLLGAAWPVMHTQIGAQISWAGIVSLIGCAGTIVSSLLSHRLTSRFGCGKVTAVSVFMTAVALIGFSVSDSFWMVCLCAVPYGLGAGGVDAALNNYVALHYESKHMSWLHCMWGIGAAIGPYIMSYALSGEIGWPMGYRYVGGIQILLTVFLFLSLPLWKGSHGQQQEPKSKPLSLRQILGISGAKDVIVVFFCYCALEAVTGLWSATYLVTHKAYAEELAAGLAALFYVGITAGRFVSGFVTMKLSDTAMIRLGLGILAVGVITMMLPLGVVGAALSLLLLGLGCAPIYPCVIHSTPAHFGAENAQALIGVQMAAAYVGICVMSPVFGWIADYLGARWLPVFLAVLLAMMMFMHERLVKVCPVKA